MDVTTIESTANRILVSEREISISPSASSISFLSSFTVLRGTMTPGIPAAGSGKGISKRAKRWPSVATARNTCPFSSPAAWRYMPFK